MGRIISKKQIRFYMGYSSRKTFNSHLESSGVKGKLPDFFWAKKTFFEEEIQILEQIFNLKFIKNQAI